MIPAKHWFAIGCSPISAVTYANSRSHSSTTGPDAVDLHEEREATTPTSLLGWLQADIAANRASPPEKERPLLSEGDTSVQFHACHGPDRQVEVLREVLVGLLADDATLEPRDIVVMCPDIENFAPLIAASFGLDTAEAPSRASWPSAPGETCGPLAAAAQPASCAHQPAGCARRVTR